MDMYTHTSKIKVLLSSLNSKETLQNFLQLYKKKTHVVFFIFPFKQPSFFPLSMPVYVDIVGIQKLGIYVIAWLRWYIISYKTS